MRPRCPSCKKTFTLWSLVIYLFGSLKAPFFYRCRSCHKELRFAKARSVITCFVSGIVGTLVANAIGLAIWLGHGIEIRSVAGIALLLVFSMLGVLVGVAIPLSTWLRDQLRVCEESERKSVEERQYVRRSLLGMILLSTVAGTVVAISIPYWLPSFSFYGSSLDLSRVTPDSGVPLGDEEQSWTLTSLDGTTLRFGDLGGQTDQSGKVVFLNIWATWCGPCVAEFPSIQSLEESVRGTDVAFALVSEEKADKVKAFVAREGYTLPFYISEGPLPKAFQTRGIPATFVIDRTGSIVYHHLGSADWNDDQVRDLFSTLLNRK